MFVLQATTRQQKNKKASSTKEDEKNVKFKWSFDISNMHTKMIAGILFTVCLLMSHKHWKGHETSKREENKKPDYEVDILVK